MKMFGMILLLFSTFSLSYQVSAQNASEKKLAEIDIKQNADVNMFVYDPVSGRHVYVENVSQSGKMRILSGNSVSGEFSYIMPEYVRFFPDGKYAAFGETYEESQNISSASLIIEGEVVYKSDFIDWVSSYINSNGDVVFYSKEGESYFLCNFSRNSGIKRSSPFKEIRPSYSIDFDKHREGDETIRNDNYTLNSEGRRIYVGEKNGKSYFLDGATEIESTFGGIDNLSLCYATDGELCYIANESGTLTSMSKGFFVVKGGKRFRTFDYVYSPLRFDERGSVYYLAADSAGDYMYRYYLVKDNDPVPGEQPASGYYVSWVEDVKVGKDGSLSYVKWVSEDVPYSEGENKPASIASYFVQDGSETLLGYNIGEIQKSSDGRMIYSASMKEALNKSYLYALTNGKREKITARSYDLIMGYGFSPQGKIYYTGSDYKTSGEYEVGEAEVCVEGEEINKVSFLIYQMKNDSLVSIAFSDKGEYAYVAEEKLGEGQYSNVIYMNGKKLPFPECRTPGAKFFFNVFNLFFSKNERMFHTAITRSGEDYLNNLTEVFVDNKTTGLYYNSIGVVKYDYNTNEASFLAARGNAVYDVKVKF